MSDLNEMNVGLRWYVIHTNTGYENKVMTNLARIIEKKGLQDQIVDMRIPTETSTETKADGTEKINETRLMPSYVFIRMVMTDETWHVVRNVTGVTGFVGPGSRPTPLSDAEVDAMAFAGEAKAIAIKVGDNVEVVSGLFAGSTGVVNSITEDGKSAVVAVNRGRRSMPVELKMEELKAANA